MLGLVFCELFVLPCYGGREGLQWLEGVVLPVKLSGWKKNMVRSSL